jgi:hypothetical protein
MIRSITVSGDIARSCLLVAVLVLASCVSAHSTTVTPNRYAQVPAAEVQVYASTDEMPGGCERVALIHAAGHADWTDRRQMIAAARRRAGKAGRNAVVIDTIRDPCASTRAAAEVLGVPADRKGRMVAYRCTPHPADVSVSSPASHST